MLNKIIVYTAFVSTLVYSQFALSNQMNRINSEISNNKEISSELEKDKGKDITATVGAAKENADKAHSQNLLASGIQLVTSGTMAMSAVKSGQKCAKKVYYECGMMVLYSLYSIQSLQTAKSHKEAAGTAFDFSTGVDGLGDTLVASDYSKFMDPSSMDIINKTIDGKLLKDAGMYDAKTGIITGPDGKKYDSSKLGSSAGLKAAGFSDSQINQANALARAAATKAEKGVNTEGLAALTGGGGAGGTTIQYIDEEPLDALAAGSGNSGLGSSLSNRDPANIAGLSKDYNGEPIGVAADSIFLMMHRRYKVKDSQESFYNEIEMPVQVRRSK